MSSHSDLPGGSKTVSITNDPPSSHGRRPDGDLALRLSNGKLRMALEIGKFGSWEQDVATGEFTGTSTFRAILGLPLDAPINSEQMQQMFQPGGAERIQQAIAYAIRTRTDFQVEHRILRADGRVRHLLARGAAIYEGNEPVRLMGIVQDVTEREEIREERSRAQKRQQFLRELNDQISNQEDPFAIMEIAARSLAQFLKVDAAGFGEVLKEKGIITVDREWSKGIINHRGFVVPIDSVPNIIMDAFTTGKTIILNDTKTDPRVVADTYSQTQYATTNTRTNVTIPIMRNGRLVAYGYCNSSQPRSWPSEDIALVEDAAVRTWIGVEKARTEAELRETQDRLRALLEASSSNQLPFINPDQQSS